MKSYKIALIPSAKYDLSEMVDYLASFYPTTAVKQYDRLMEQIAKLKQFPLMCEEYGSVMGIDYRKMVVDNYLVFYTVVGDTVEIHRIINGRTDFMKWM